MLSTTLADYVQEYYKAINEGTSATVINDILTRVQRDLRQNLSTSVATSVPPLIFFNFLGFDTSWADFDLLDVISVSTSSGAKREGYCASEVMWTSQSPVSLLVPNRISRDLTSSDPHTASSALTAVSSYMTEQLAEHIMSDVIALMSSMRPFVRQRAITTYYTIMNVYGPALRAGIGNIRSALDDSYDGVILAALSVFCELAAKEPSPFVPLIPKFHHMLVASVNPWTQIKLIKILKYLCAAEQRLPRKLVQPFMTLIDSTSSHNVLFETIQAVIEIPITNQPLISNALQRVQGFVWCQDANLRYIALQLFMKLVHLRPKLVTENKEIISECINSEDENIRVAALDLLGSLASRKTIDNVVGRIFEQIASTRKVTHKNMLVAKIIEICSKDDYDMISDFSWYVDVLTDIAEEPNITCFGLIAEQYLDMATRVPSAREKLVDTMCLILQDPRYFKEDQLLLVAAFIIGEYASDSTPFDSILQPMIVNDSERVQACCISASLKLYLKSSVEERKEIDTLFSLKLPLFACSQYAEVQERAESLITLLPILQKADEKTIEDMRQKLAKDPDDDDEEEEEAWEPITKPEGLDAPFDIFTTTEADEEYFNPDKKRSKGKKSGKGKGRRKGKGKGKKKGGKRNKKKKVASNLSEDFLIRKDDSESDDSSYEYEEEVRERRKRRKRRHSKPENILNKSQLLGQNSCLIVRATDFSVMPSQPNIVDVELLITNCSRTAFDTVDIHVTETANLKFYQSDDMETLEPGATQFHRVAIESVITNVPQTVKVLFIPSSSSGETLEAKIRLLPSLFLMPGDQLLYPSAEESVRQATEGRKENKCSVKCNVRPRDALQAVVKLLNPAIMKNADPNSRTLYSRTTSGNDVICIFKIVDSIAECTIKSQDMTLTTSLIREVEMKLRSLNN